ncbi:hypothetical protein ACTS95_00390 [Empedobacter brevis]|uniref:Uncharacterized protein n=1 Tax=Empedobacter brevis NBRC 14943 = ATCC 43319 TaxID=1218108 RepID=A0A511NHB8_9FLAO|nr:hypothetical protein [Empedobacter brevis]GEM52204.1 hypothetical protein EB1_19940 [Empedobacter brevis NBRC 14943 = ATCC 43319]
MSGFYYMIEFSFNYFAGASVAGVVAAGASAFKESTVALAESTTALAESTTVLAESTTALAESTVFSTASSAFFSPQDTAPNDKAATATTAKNFFIVLLF